MSVTIRPPLPSEIEPLFELMRGLARYERLEHELTGTPEALARHVFGDAVPRVEARVAELDSALVGYALTFPIFSSFHCAPLLWLEDLFVEPSARGQGIGFLLMSEVARIALAKGMKRVGWIVLDWNQPSIDFYRRLGAEPATGWDVYGIRGAALERLATSGSMPAGSPSGSG